MKQVTVCFSENFFIKLTIHFQDGSGTITTKELLPILRSIGQNPTEDEILNLVIEYDVNGDGTIDFDEFLEMMQKVSKGKNNFYINLKLDIMSIPKSAK